MAKKITLQNSKKKAIVDDEDFEYLNQFKWFLSNSGYAYRSDGKRFIYMHDEVIARDRSHQSKQT